MTALKPLDGMHVLDTTDEWGELSGRLLAELGAEVRRIEPPGGSRSTTLSPSYEGIGLFHAYRSLGKYRYALDLGAPEDRQKMENLFSWADVWLDSAPARARTEIAAEPEDVLARHPHLVITSITPFGRTGPYSSWAATDSVIEAVSGMMFKAGIPEKPPLIPPSSIANDIGAVTATFATLVASWQKRQTGHGQHIDLSLNEAAAQTTDWSLPNASIMRSFNLPYSQTRSGAGIYGIYPCKDGWIRIVILSARQWHSIRAWMGEPDFLQDPRYDILPARIEIGELLAALYTELFADMNRDEATAEAQRRGIAATPVLYPDDVLKNQHLASRNLFRDYEVGPGLRAPVHSGFFEVDGERLVPDFGCLPLETMSDTPLEHREDPAGPAPQPSLPLSGLQVMDFGIGGVGVEGGRLFAEYGANVIKIETRNYPDFMRFITGTPMNPSFASSSRSKRALGVNAKREGGRDVLYHLMRSTDVIIENSSTGTMSSLQLGFDAVHEVNPRTVMVSSQLLGSRGPWSDWIGYGPSTQPVAGLFGLWDYEDDDPPAGSTSIMPDHLAGRILALGAMAGLLARDRTGVGCHVEVAQVEVAAATIGDQLLKAALAPGSVRPQGNRRDDGAPWGAYPCAGDEEWCVITVRNDEDWVNLQGALGQPEWAAAPELATTQGRRKAHDDIDKHLGEWTSPQAKREVAATLQRFGVPAAPMLTGSDQLDDPHLLAHHYPTTIEQQGLGPLTLEGPCFTATGMSPPVITQAPTLGQHTLEICRDTLGYSDEEIQLLVEAGAIEVPEPAQ